MRPGPEPSLVTGISFAVAITAGIVLVLLLL